MLSRRGHAALLSTSDATLNITSRSVLAYDLSGSTPEKPLSQCSH